MLLQPFLYLQGHLTLAMVGLDALSQFPPLLLEFLLRLSQLCIHLSHLLFRLGNTALSRLELNFEVKHVGTHAIRGSEFGVLRVGEFVKDARVRRQTYSTLGLATQESPRFFDELLHGTLCDAIHRNVSDSFGESLRLALVQPLWLWLWHWSLKVDAQPDDLVLPEGHPTEGTHTGVATETAEEGL